MSELIDKDYFKNMLLAWGERTIRESKCRIRYPD